MDAVTGQVAGVNIAAPVLAGQARLRIPSQRPLFPGCPAVFIATGPTVTDVYATAGLVGTEGMGLVATMSGATPLGRIQEVAQAINAVGGGPRMLLVDAGRYAGQQRVSGPTALSQDWVQAQVDAGLPVACTDSPYIGKGDTGALNFVLDQAVAFDLTVIAVLPLHLTWLYRRAAELVETINTAGIPVALVLEHTDDPLGSVRSVRGLVHVLEHATVPVCLFRSDISVIGAVAFGASLGAIGTTTGRRHLYPSNPDTEATKFFRGAQTAAYVPSCMTYRSLPKLNDAIGADPDHQERWSCLCRYCDGRSLSWIADEVSAYQHSLASIAAMGEAVLGHLSDPQLMRRSWVAKCRVAQTTNLEIGADTGIRWGPPGFQGAWHSTLEWEDPAALISQ